MDTFACSAQVRRVQPTALHWYPQPSFLPPSRCGHGTTMTVLLRVVEVQVDRTSVVHPELEVSDGTVGEATSSNVGG